jgi:hypothetical protein
MIKLIDLGFYFRRETYTMQLVSVLKSPDDIADFADLPDLW